MAFVVELRLAVAVFNDSKFPLQNRSQEVSVSASRFKEPGVNAFGLVLHQIEHRIDLALASQHLAVVRDALS